MIASQAARYVDRVLDDSGKDINNPKERLRACLELMGHAGALARSGAPVSKKLWCCLSLEYRRMLEAVRL